MIQTVSLAAIDFGLNEKEVCSVEESLRGGKHKKRHITEKDNEELVPNP